MPKDPWPGVSLQINRRRRRCVLDPLFCLSQPGAAFISAMAPYAEMWLGPEFLNILDNWPIYHHKPELLGWPGEERYDPDELRDALRVWQHLRDGSGHVGGPLCWVRDALRESCLPQGIDDAVVPRFEALAEALDGRLAASAYRTGPLTAAIRDTAALAGVLPGAVVLGLCRQNEPWLPPALCDHLRAWHLPCERLNERNTLVSRERDTLIDLLVDAGVSSFLWAGLRVAVVHVVVPGQRRFVPVHALATEHDCPEFLPDEECNPIKGPWDDARAFWYELAAEDAHVRA
jgi:hypothetical protein